VKHTIASNLVVWWLDSDSAIGWDDYKSQPSDDGLCVSRGVYLKKDKKFLYLAGDTHQKKDGSEHQNRVIYIPLENIRHIHKVISTRKISLKSL
jgi:hypothetical protein